MYQSINPTTTSTLLTPWASEWQSAKNFGFTQEAGQPVKASMVAATGLTPVRRLFSSARGDFAWALQGSALFNQLVGSGYADQMTNFFASAVPQGSCSLGLKSFVKNGHHRYEVEGAEATLLAAGWTVEATAFYAVGERPPTTSPVPQPAPQPEPQPGSGTFSFAVMPDTQDESYGGDLRMPKRVSYLVNNRAALGLQWVMHSGDVHSWDTADHKQFVNMSGYLQPLATAAIPYLLAAGNHDTAVVCPGGSACPGINPNVALRDTTTWNAYYPPSRFGLEATFDGRSENGYRTYSAGGVNWLVLSLELWPRQQVIDWAKGVISRHPRHNVIVQTHAFLQPNGAVSTYAGGYGSTSPATLWNALDDFPNVVMVFSGHDGTGAVTTLTAADGHKVVAMLQAYHDYAKNPVRLVNVDVDNGSISTEVRASWDRVAKSDIDYLYPGSATVTGMRWVR